MEGKENLGKGKTGMERRIRKRQGEVLNGKKGKEEKENGGKEKTGMEMRKKKGKVGREGKGIKG